MTLTRFFQTALATILVSATPLFAQTPAATAQAEQTKLVSFASTGDCTAAVQYVKGPYNAALDGSKFDQAAQMANDVAEICLNAGDADSAEAWARMSYAAGMQQKGLKPADSNLLDYRWNATMARIDAMRGDTLAKAKAALEKKDETSDAEDAKEAKGAKDAKDAKDSKDAKAKAAAAKEANSNEVSDKMLLSESETVENRVAAATAAIKKGVGSANAAQLTAFLSGAVAFDQGDFKSAATSLQQADQSDPLVIALLAQAYDKAGDKAQAEQLYQKAAAVTAQTPNGAYARLVAQKAGKK